MMTITQKSMGGGESIGTITTNIGNPAPRHGFKIIEVHRLPSCQEDKD